MDIICNRRPDITFLQLLPPLPGDNELNMFPNRVKSRYPLNNICKDLPMGAPYIAHMGQLWGTCLSAGPRWIPRTKASDAELWCFLWSAPEWTVE